MFRHLFSIGLAALVTGAATEAAAQPKRSASAVPVLAAASRGGVVQGVVIDDAGASVNGVTVIAMGTALAAGVSDSRGRFVLALPAGDYILRAALAGYVSTFREAVRIRSNATVERRITLLRSAAPAPTAAAPVPVPAAAPAPVGADRSGDNHGEISWRLRHLPRTVLRDIAPGNVPSGGAWSNDWDDASLLDVLVTRPVRQTTTFLTNTDFTGQVNLITAASMSGESLAPAVWSRGIADLIVGAPVGTLGDWSVRAALGADDMDAWTLLGEYRARASRRHAIRVALSYSTQGYVTGPALPTLHAASASRSVGGVRLADRWRTGADRVEVDYGGRINRYDYLSEPNVVGGHLATRARIVGKTALVARVSQDMIAPGADQFLPPSASGPWLPPTRTFSPLAKRGRLDPEQVRNRSLGVEQRFGSERGRVVAVEWFAQSTTNQLATIFGLDDASAVGHYYVASPGSVGVVGWRARMGGDLHEHVHGSVEFMSGRAEWQPAALTGALRRSAPALVRRGTESMSDVRTSLGIHVPRTFTHVTFDYRLSVASNHGAAGVPPMTSGRLNLELRQQLPYQPSHSGEWNVLFTLRTLVHDLDAGALYDEVLTAHPPARMTGGLQVRF